MRWLSDERTSNTFENVITVLRLTLRISKRLSSLRGARHIVSYFHFRHSFYNKITRRAASLFSVLKIARSSRAARVVTRGAYQKIGLKLRLAT